MCYSEEIQIFGVLLTDSSEEFAYLQHDHIIAKFRAYVFSLTPLTLKRLRGCHFERPVVFRKMYLLKSG